MTIFVCPNCGWLPPGPPEDFGPIKDMMVDRLSKKGPMRFWKMVKFAMKKGHDDLTAKETIWILIDMQVFELDSRRCLVFSEGGEEWYRKHYYGKPKEVQ